MIAKGEINVWTSTKDYGGKTQGWGLLKCATSGAVWARLISQRSVIIPCTWFWSQMIAKGDINVWKSTNDYGGETQGWGLLECATSGAVQARLITQRSVIIPCTLFWSQMIAKSEVNNLKSTKDYWDKIKGWGLLECATSGAVRARLITHRSVLIPCTVNNIQHQHIRTKALICHLSRHWLPLISYHWHHWLGWVWISLSPPLMI